MIKIHFLMYSILCMNTMWKKYYKVYNFFIFPGQVWIYRQSNGQTSGKDEERELWHAQVSTQTWVVGYLSRTWQGGPAIGLLWVTPGRLTLWFSGVFSMVNYRLDSEAEANLSRELWFFLVNSNLEWSFIGMNRTTAV